MTTLSTITSLLGDFLKIAPGLVLLPFSIYFFWKKISHKASATFSISMNRVTAPRLSDIVIANLKDKPLVIWALHARINKEQWLTIQKFEHPLILKGLETVNINPPPVSEYNVKSDTITNPFGSGKHVEIFITSTDKIFKCLPMTYPENLATKKFSELTYITSTIKSYKGITYNNNVKFAITYEYNGQTEVALLENNGCMTHGWPFIPNRFQADHISDTATVRRTFEATGITDIVKILSVVDIEKNISNFKSF
ncbi:hypothetical protein [Pseudomonas sp. PAMC 25886]|uniref:hypothetical protein n=1 Tax=Pseudomonas sp. PAMC 25886 TaxID=1125977 RepID=UPI001146D8AA|nr:hypothetical protein [Pseudomonas sp. PAMC 25886]